MRFEEKNKTKKKAVREFALRGFFTCAECGCSITAEVQRGHTYYRCTKSKGKCSQPFIREEALEREVELILELLEMDQEMIDIIVESVKETEEEEISRIETIKKSVEDRLSKVKREQKELLRGFIAKKVTDELYEEMASELEEERFALEHQLKHVSVNRQRTFELIERILNKAKSARQDFIEGTGENKKEVLEMVASNLVLSNKEIVSYQLKEPFEMISKWPKSSDSEILWRIAGANQGIFVVESFRGSTRYASFI